MKHLLILPALLLLFNVSAQSQAVEDGSFQLNLGTGFGLHGVTTDDPALDNDFTVSGLLNGSFYYSITERWSVGLIFERNGFVVERDSSEKAVGLSVMLGGKYRFVNNDKTAVNAQLLFGSSSFLFERTDTNDQIKGNGVNVQVGIGLNHYFTHRFGFFTDMIISTYTFNQLKDENDIVILNSDGKSDLTINFTGVSVRLGGALRF